MDTLNSFIIENGQIRGCFIRIEGLLNDMLQRRSYPPEIAGLLGEAVALSAVLSSALKYNGTFTLQVQGEGPVSLIVADMTSQKTVRAYAKFNPERFSALAKRDLRTMVGNGHMAFTVDHVENPERYQGVVELGAATLTEVVQSYFRHSEQIETAIKTVSTPTFAAALMIQRMPVSETEIREQFDEEAEDVWRTAVILLGSLKNEEMEDVSLPPEKLLHRLYHANGLETFEPSQLSFACRCSYERIHEVIQALPEQERVTLLRDGKISVTCEFCGKKYEINDA